MNHNSLLFIFSISTMMLFALNANAAPHDVFGTYFTKDKGSKIQISDCGDGRKRTIGVVAPSTIQAKIKLMPHA